jgi:hypothetical protein
MPDVTFVACGRCEAEGDVSLPAHGAQGPLVCMHCGALITMISVEPWQGYIERRVAELAERQRSGQLGTRKQSLGQSDQSIDRDGREAELAACLLLCPGQRLLWQTNDGPNRGNDLRREWTLLPKPVEVKQTRYCDDRRGCLIVRPPRNTPGYMRAEYIDDCLYVLMHGQKGLFTLLGWTDRDHLLSVGELNPIPVRPGQRECWGMHWRQLRPPDSLLEILPREPRRCLG